MVCDCQNLFHDVKEFINEILPKGNERSQWVKFEKFLKKYTGDDTRDIREFTHEINTDFPYGILCSLKICSLLAHKLVDFINSDAALSTVLLNLLTLLHTKECLRSCTNRVWDFKRNISIEWKTNYLLSALSIKFHRAINCDFMKLSLEYGLLYSLPGDSPCLMGVVEIECDHFLAELHFPAMMNDSWYTENVMKLVKDIFFQYGDKEFHKRMYLVIMALRAVQKSMRCSSIRQARELMSKIKMYFTGTQDVIISVFEVRSVLYACCKLLNKLDLFDVYCEFFQFLMPECPAKLQPRKLTHIARFQIRQNLSKGHIALPSAVDKLQLPDILKGFLLGKIDISRGNNSLQNYVTESELEAMMSRSIS